MNLPLQPLKWEDREDSAMVTTVFRGYWVTSDKESKGKFCAYYGSSSSEPARGFATIEDAKRWAEYEHYAGEMQPYVKPSPTWFNYETEKPRQGDSIVIAWVWMGDKHTIWLESYSPAEIDYLDDCLEVYWLFSPFKSKESDYE